MKLSWNMEPYPSELLINLKNEAHSLRPEVSHVLQMIALASTPADIRHAADEAYPYGIAPGGDYQTAIQAAVLARLDEIRKE